MRREIWRQSVGVIICDQFWYLWGFHQKSVNTSLNVCLILQRLWANLYLCMLRDRYSTSRRSVNYVRKSQTILLRKKRHDFHNASVFNWKIPLIFFFFFDCVNVFKKSLELYYLIFLWLPRRKYCQNIFTECFTSSVNLTKSSVSCRLGQIYWRNS